MLKPCCVLWGGALLLRSLAAGACGGGTVTALGAEIGADAQRIYISVHGSTTEVVTQIIVPESSADYGVLIPVPVEPTLDPKPVPAGDLDVLDKLTAPRIYASQDSGDEGGGCSCIPVSGDDGGDPAEPLPGVMLSEPVDIGPITAVVLTGDTASAVDGWLQEHGFDISEANRPIVEAYSGSGHYFIAIRRNAASTGGPSSIGIHFTLPGDQRGLPLRFASIGAAPTVAFTLFVGADTAVAPSAPFESLLLADLDAGLLRSSYYAGAVERAVAQHGERAFVLEGQHPKTSLEHIYYDSSSGPRLPLAAMPLFQWLPDGGTLTRLSTRMTSAAMTEDVAFDTPFLQSLPSDRFVRAPSATDLRPAPAGALFGLVLTAALRRIRRRGN
jgi:hypothetical protein